MSDVSAHNAPATVLDRLVESVRARNRSIDGQESPAAILWTDPDGQWLPLVDLLRERVPELLVFGDYRPQERSGPAVWLRCMVDGAITDPALPADRPPILYLPRVGRQHLRAGQDCPEAWRPLVELMYRGVLWTHPNGNDWGVAAFLTSRDALALDIARDRATAEALLRALREVALTPLAQLAGRHLQADDFDRMLAADVIRDILRWMGDPDGTRERMGVNGWEAFRNRCKDELGFDPESDADVVAGERMAKGAGRWGEVWDRFVEAPTGFGNIAGLLRRSRPISDFAFAADRWPDLNDAAEKDVREGLAEVAHLSPVAARDAVEQLEREHARRRDWVWARLGQAPMAEVLQPLATLAAATRVNLGGATPDELAAAYLERGWQADAAAWEALACCPTADESLVETVVRHLLLTWADDSARAFQQAVARSPLPARGGLAAVTAANDACILFADGLRFDLGQRLAERLTARGHRVQVDHRWAALPTVTATAKPAVTPVADDVGGDGLREDFAAQMLADGKPASAANLRAAIAARGYQILGADGADAPTSHPARGWLECGEIDSLGHQRGARLAEQIGKELDRLVDRIQSLLDSGWSAVRVVTDHGWLLLPGGLPKVDLPKHLTASRWARCAVIAGESAPDVARAPWHWNATQWFATAPGIACFNKSDEYAHGGISIQECLAPDLLVERAEQDTTGATIRSITWRGLRCFAEVSSHGGVVVADLRLGRPSGPSVAASQKPVEADGSVSLVLPDDEHEDAALVLVLIDEAGRILAHRATAVGANA